MAIKLPPLPFDKKSLEPHMSKETLEFHYGKHHKTYVEKTNELIKGTPYDKIKLQDIVQKSYEKDKKIFNNAAQAWNHEFFWNCLTSAQDEGPSVDLQSSFEESFGSVEDFQEQFTKKATEHFGSGWSWLVKNSDDTLAIITLSNAGTPLVKGLTPLLTCDVWEHAYYIDYRNERPKFLENYWKLVNWNFVEQNHKAATSTKRRSTTSNPKGTDILFATD